MKADSAGSIHLVVLKQYSFSFNHVFCRNLEFIVLTGTLDIATDDEPQPFVIFVSNGSRTDTDETVS